MTTAKRDAILLVGSAIVLTVGFFVIAMTGIGERWAALFAG